jgi:hypothetical protein
VVVVTKLHELAERLRSMGVDPDCQKEMPHICRWLVDCADELAAALAEQGWRSMDSAPKSTLDEHGRVRGVFLLGFCPDEAVDPASCLSVIWWEPLTDGGVWYGQEAMTVRPTHWMPLPPPPPESAR